MLESYIDLYMKTVENSKPAIEYHKWCMLSTLSVFAGRRFWFPFGPYNYYPHIYTVLVGDPGIAKSSAMDRAKNIVRAVKCAPVAPTSTTKESITLIMGGEKFTGKKYFTYDGRRIEYNQYAIFATELTQFMGANPIGMLDWLTTIWTENVYEVETKNKGSDYIIGPYVTLCACMTPELVKGFLKQNVLLGGFARRTSWIFSNYSNEVAIPTYTDEQKKAELKCVEFGKMLQTKCGQFGWTDDLQQFYKEWHHENHKTLTDRPMNQRGWFESKGEMLFKLCMLISLANEGGDCLTLDIPHFKMALHYCEVVEKNLHRVFEGAGINPNATAITQICTMLEGMSRPINLKVLLAMFMHQVTSIPELKDTLEHLVSVGRLAIHDVIEPTSRILLGTLIGSPSSIAKCKAMAGTEQVAVLKIGIVVQPNASTMSGPPSLPDLQT